MKYNLIWREQSKQYPEPLSGNVMLWNTFIPAKRTNDLSVNMIQIGIDKK